MLVAKNSDRNRQERIVERTRGYFNVPYSTTLKNRQSPSHSGTTYADFNHDFKHSGTPYNGHASALLVAAH